MLNELIETFGEKKAELDKIKKETDKLSNSIKDEFKSSELNEFESKTFVAKMNVIDNDAVNEKMLIGLIKVLNSSGVINDNTLANVIKTREYIDNDALEDAIYTKQIPSDIITQCIEHKDPTYRLTVKRRK